MSLKLNIPVKCHATEISYYQFEIERNGEVKFETVSGNVESTQLSKTPPIKDFKTIEPTDKSVQVKAGETLYVTVKGKNYRFSLNEKLKLQLGSYELLTGLSYTIDDSDRNLILKVKDRSMLELSLNGLKEDFEVCKSDVTFSCKGGVTLKFSNTDRKIGVELCQAYF